jgi:hypothetical protein
MAHGRLFEQGGAPSGDSALWQSDQLICLLPVSAYSVGWVERTIGERRRVYLGARGLSGGLGQVPSFRQAQAGGRFGRDMERIGASHRQHSTERSPIMKRAARAPARLRTSQGGRPCKPAKILPTIRRKDLPTVHLPRQTRSQGGKTKLTNHRAAIILHAISCGCYRETAAELAGIKAETLSHWMGWSGEPYETFQRLVRKAEAGLESRMVTILTGQAEVRPELALAILERKFPQRWAKVTVVAAPPHHLTFNVADILQKVQERIAQGRAQAQLPGAIINAAGNPTRPHDPRPPRLAVVSDRPEDSEPRPT